MYQVYFLAYVSSLLISVYIEFIYYLLAYISSLLIKYYYRVSVLCICLIEETEGQSCKFIKSIKNFKNFRLHVPIFGMSSIKWLHILTV